MKIVLHSKTRSPGWHPRYREAFTVGFSLHGEDVAWTPEDEVTVDGLHVLFGPNYWSKTFFSGSPVLCVDRCSVGDANDFVTVGFGGWGGAGMYPRPEPAASRARWEKWQHLFPTEISSPQKGSHAVILGEYPSACDDVSSINGFYERSRMLAEEEFRGIYFRPHPFHDRNLKGTVLNKDKVILHTAKRIYTYKTSFGVHCRLLGLPVDASPVSLAHPYWDNELWKSWLLFTQWHVEELRSGEFWEHLKCLTQ